MKCYFCKNHVDKKELIKVELRNGEKADMCRNCRKKHNLETQDDIIERIKENIKTPMEIVKELDKYVIGQEEAKKDIAVEVYNHFIRVINKNKVESLDKVIKKNNILLNGPSGTGKTLIAETLAKILGVPFYIASATGLTESGYVGNDVESVLSGLLRSANMNVHKAQFGIIFIDEIDKIATKKSESMSITRDVSGEGVQQALLKLIEGSVVGIPENGGRIHPQQKLIEIDTKNILFICSGAFEGIENIVRKRLNVKSKATLGFKSNTVKTLSKEDISEKSLRANVNSEDLKDYGLIKEFIGRLPIIANLLPLDKEQLVEILNAKNGILEEYKSIFELQNKSLSFSRDSLEMISDLAIDRKVGARGLRSIVTSFMRDLMFYAPSEPKKEYYMTKKHVENFFKNKKDKNLKIEKAV